MAIITYIIADDHKVFRQGLNYTLNSDAQLKCIGEAENGAQLLQLLDSIQPDVILMDMKMPEMDGMEATKAVKAKHPNVKIIMLTMYDDENFVLHMLDVGVNGYLTKNADPEEIIKAIHTVNENDYYFNDMVSKLMLKTIVKKKQIEQRTKENVQLNDKEKEILRLICLEHTNAEIAEKVFLSQRTVEGIRSTLLEKIGVRNTAGLVVYAVKNGIVE
ncbi:MAG: response regulator transcription factor [Chitinophagales bacterium]|nr:response regulator transcription factor [Chitinophagales bacterium]